MAIRPSTVIQKMSTPPKYNGCVPTFKGDSFNVLDPKPEHIFIEDVTQGLAHTFRYGGQIGPITVAEHSILVSMIIDILWPKSGVALAGLLHEACETYLHDIQAPVRKYLKVSMPNGDLITWGDLERKLNGAVSKALSDGGDFYTHPEVQAADILALCLEKRQIPSIANEDWGTPPIPAEIEHLVILFLEPKDAAVAFKARYDKLKGQ